MVRGGKSVSQVSRDLGVANGRRDAGPPPKLGRHRYEVYVKPLGYSALCTNEQVSVKASRHSLL